jgi:adenine-specific DNA glycosylase
MEDDKVGDVSSLVKYLKRWYWKFGRREIWWRKTRLTPYEVFVIETFLWKTRAESVVELAKKILARVSRCGIPSEIFHETIRN